MTYKEAWNLLRLWLEERADRYDQLGRLSANAGLDDLAKLDAPKAETLRDVIAIMGRIEDKIEEEDCE